MRIKNWKTLLILAIAGSLSGCKEKKPATLPTVVSAVNSVAVKYTPPVIPDSIRETPQAVSYLVQHYWDSIDFADTLYLHANDMMEQTWCNYCNLLSNVPPAIAARSIREVIKRADASPRMFKYLTGLAEKYLYDPNSPMRNEEHYIPVLREMLASSSLSPAHKIRPQAQLKLALKNRVGQKGGNFRYTLANGEKGYLYQIKAEYLLIFFNNPDCSACRETINLLQQAPAISSLFAAGLLKILSLYPDEEVDYWQQHLNEFPSQWILAYDKERHIRSKQIYDLKALPTLYLLNKSKIVLLKDATPQQVDFFLQNINRK